jgi:hypothetical protein
MEGRYSLVSGTILAIHKDEHAREPLNGNEGVYLSRKPWTKLLKFHRSRLFMFKFGFVKS